MTRQMIELAFKPMKVFVHLAAQTIEAEYPSFSIIAAFACFDVQPSTTELDMAAQEKHLRRLSQVLNVDFEQLQCQFGDHLPIAIHSASNKRLTNVAAWSDAVRRTSTAQKPTQMRHPSDILKIVLVRYVAWQGCSTSGVEQFFSHGQHQLDPSRESFYRRERVDRAQGNE